MPECFLLPACPAMFVVLILIAETYVKSIFSQRYNCLFYFTRFSLFGYLVWLLLPDARPRLKFIVHF